MTKEQLIGCYSYEEGTLNVDNNIIYFTKTENEVMNTLINNYGKFIKFDFLYEQVYNEEYDETLLTALKTCVSRTRIKTKKYLNIISRRNFKCYKLEVIKDED